MSNFEKVRDFHVKYNLDRREKAARMHPEASLLRIRLMSEELTEVIEALQHKGIKDVAKELADLLYVVYGTAVAAGIDLDVAFDKVHTSNMTKSTNVDPGGKIIKGSDYKPVIIEEILDA
jgi:predicted HAD superfamily Cof-like phosphohydrolase